MESFEVENFRSLKHLKLEKLARVNLLVGKNNSGKTSSIEALFALAITGDSEVFSTLEEERRLPGREADFRYFFYEFNKKNKITLKAIYYDNKKSEMIASLELGEDNSGSTSMIVSLSFEKNDKARTFELTRDNFNRLSINDNDPNKTLGGFSETESLIIARHQSSEILTTNIDRRTLSEKIESIKFNKRDNVLTKLMQSIDHRIVSFNLGIGGQIYLDLGDTFRTLLPLNLLGEGIQRLLDIAAAMNDNIGGTVLIDEIDNGLHYSALRILWKGIMQAAREYDVQVFATTHSAEALRHLTWVLDDEEHASYRNDVAAYTLIRANDDTVRSYRYDYEQLDYALEHDIEVRN